MRLYVIDEKNEKVQLKYDALSRAELALLIGSRKFSHEGKMFTVDDVKAETNKSSAVPAALGAAIGVVGGGPGIAIGGLIGALVGESVSKEDVAKVKVFNESQ